MMKVNGWNRLWAVLPVCVLTAIVSPCQIFNKIADFGNTKGGIPEHMSFTQGTNGDLFGTTSSYGVRGGGTVFSLTLDGEARALSFCDICSGGSMPEAGLTLATDGDLYGTTSGGGLSGCVDGCGTIFRVTPNGSLTLLYNFCSKENCSDGAEPIGAMIQGADGNLYGTTAGGGNGGGGPRGTVFRFALSGALTTLYSFCSQSGCPDGAVPYGGLIQATDGNFYGTTTGGGNAPNGGTVFRITSAGELTTLYRFCAQSGCSDGSSPWAGVVQGTDGNFYGTTSGGGSTAGNVFKVTPEGAFSALYSFCAQPPCLDGAFPYSALVQATDGNFYGTTSALGANGNGGTIFEITASGALTTIYNFCAQTKCADGNLPFGGLLQDTNGVLYGTTATGGAHNVGAAFSLNVGLGPFVTFVQSFGKVRQTCRILGQSFTGTSAVSFNGIPATFKVVSDTYLTATVPPGATTGYVTVTTPSGLLTSNVPFHVIQ